MTSAKEDPKENPQEACADEEKIEAGPDSPEPEKAGAAGAVEAPAAAAADPKAADASAAPEEAQSPDAAPQCGSERASSEPPAEDARESAAGAQAEAVGETGAALCEGKESAEALKETTKGEEGKGPHEPHEPAEPEAGAPSSDARRSLARRILLALLAVLLAAALAAGAGWLHVKRTLLEEPAPMSAERIEILVPEGATASDALDLARRAGVTLPRWQARILPRLEPELLKRIHVGRFRFERGMTPRDVLATLSGPALVDRQVRIPEGAPVWEVMDILSAAEGLSPDAARRTDAELLAELGVREAKSLEGLLAPETYRYGTGTSDLAVLRKAVERQRRLVSEAFATKSEDCRAQTPYELLILASIIEKETGERSDRHLVSSVFNNRLRIGMALQTDPTVIYGLGPAWSGRLRKKDLETPTPWNTYLIKGLPPTPISMPSAASIEAAAHPAKTKFLYFVARGDGTSEFSATLAEHNRAVRHFIIRKQTTPLPAAQSARRKDAAQAAEAGAQPQGAAGRGRSN